jgi:hypothetical protein
MRTVLLLICSIGVACVARGTEENHKGHAAKTQGQHPATSHEHAAAGGAHVQHVQAAPSHVDTHRQPMNGGLQIQPTHASHYVNKSEGQTTGSGQAVGGATGNTTTIQRHDRVDRTSFEHITQELHAERSGNISTVKSDAKNTPNSAVAGVKFRGTGHIPESETWAGPNYTCFRNYHHEWHDKDWWRNHHNRFTQCSGGWYYWQAGYWYPAWGYSSAYSYYPYDGPIYAYAGLAPDQVIAQVQAALQALGYYNGPINGVTDWPTREALAAYQRDHGLYITSAIDEPTLESLGFARLTLATASLRHTKTTA